jgi:hypothetical protein
MTVSKTACILVIAAMYIIGGDLQVNKLLSWHGDQSMFKRYRD